MRTATASRYGETGQEAEIGASVRAVSASAGAAALVVGCGGGVERALVACLPDGDQGSGAPFGHCDGARLGFNRAVRQHPLPPRDDPQR